MATQTLASIVFTSPLANTSLCIHRNVSTLSGHDTKSSRSSFGGAEIKL